MDKKIAFEIEGYVWEPVEDSILVVPIECRFNTDQGVRYDHPKNNLLLEGKYDLFREQGILEQGARFVFRGYNDNHCEVEFVDDLREVVELPSDIEQMLKELDELQTRARTEQDRRGF
ncbi:hypothetical protein J4402_02630 [Candidatus Pacearchaeota archaeon]|nr:hypothetical protein [Candidatus Pacearchaeota archaeon]